MGHRPAHVKPPAYLSKNPPLPQPDNKEPEAAKADQPDPLGQDPTRFGDWALKGIAIDF